MIPGVFVAGILIGVVVGWAISAWHHAATEAPPVERRAHWTSVGSSNESVDAQWTREIMAKLSGRFFEIR
jgi:hypothetical protein